MINALDILAQGAFGVCASLCFSGGASSARSGSDVKLLEFDPQISELVDDGGEWSFMLVATDHLTGSTRRPVRVHFSINLLLSAPT